MIKEKNFRKNQLAASDGSFHDHEPAPGKPYWRIPQAACWQMVLMSLPLMLPEQQKTMRMRIHGMNMTLMSKSQLQMANSLTLQ